MFWLNFKNQFAVVKCFFFLPILLSLLDAEVFFLSLSLSFLLPMSAVALTFWVKQTVISRKCRFVDDL